MKKKCIELFAGAGGLALGLEKAGFEEIGLIEIDKKACDTLRLNRPNWNVIEEDVVEFSKKDLLQELIAKHSQNIVWKVKVDGDNIENDRIRRVSMDKFYEIVTGDKEAFYKLCMILPDLISEIINENKELQAGSDTVVNELKEKNPDLLRALYILAFKEYERFDKIQ